MRKNVSRPIDQGSGQRLTAKIDDIDPASRANFDPMHTRRLPAHRMNSGGIGLDILAIAEEPAEKSHRHGAAANVACADKENVFHDARSATTPRAT